MKRAINWILHFFGYHLTKYPRPYTKRKKQPELPGFEIVPFSKEDSKGFEHGR